MIDARWRQEHKKQTNERDHREDRSGGCRRPSGVRGANRSRGAGRTGALRIIDRLSQTVDQLDHGVRQVATISFLDLEGFMSLGDPMKPGQLVRFLNVFLSLMSEPIGKRGGITDKYIGDAILAVWSPTFIDPDRHAIEACQAALEQRSRLDELTRIARGQFGLGPGERIEARIGIATGDVIAGSIGPAGARSYTVVGDTVNLAARLETANKLIDTRFLAGEKTRDAASVEFLVREIGRIPIAGKREPERVFELLGTREACPQGLHELVARCEGRSCRQCGWRLRRRASRLRRRPRALAKR